MREYTKEGVAETLDKLEVNPEQKTTHQNDSSLDDNKTPEENNRDKKITSLLGEYLRSYKEKVNFLVEYKKKFLIFSIIWATILVAAVALLPIICFIVLGNDVGTVDIAGIIASEVTFAGLIFGLLKIITTYIFSPNDEKYITEIVKAIQQNDLENKKENLKHKLEMKNNSQNS